jgi:hypothetical protein
MKISWTKKLFSKQINRMCDSAVQLDPPENSATSLKIKTNLNHKTSTMEKMCLNNSSPVKNESSLNLVEKLHKDNRRDEYSEWLKKLESKYSIKQPISIQTDVSRNMTYVLFEWLYSVNESFKFCPETFFLCIYNVCRFLMVHNIDRKNLQLIGISSMMIAAKYEEVSQPEIDEYVNICANTYTTKQIVDMECLMLSTLNWNITIATHHSFLKTFMGLVNVSARERHICCVISELIALYVDCLEFSPSILAATIMILVCKIVGENIGWIENSKTIVGYTADETQDCLKIVTTALRKQKEDWGNREHRQVSSVLSRHSLINPDIPVACFSKI